MTDAERDEYRKRLDLLSTVKVAEVTTGSAGHIIELTSATKKRWRFAPLPGDDGSFEKLWDALSRLVRLYNEGLATLSSDETLKESVDQVRPDKVSPSSMKALLLLEKLAYAPKSMTFAEKRNAKALKQKIKEDCAGGRAGIVARSGEMQVLGGEINAFAGRTEGEAEVERDVEAHDGGDGRSASEGDLEDRVNTVEESGSGEGTIGGFITRRGQDEEIRAAGTKKSKPQAPQGPPPPMASGMRGWMTIAANDSLAPPARVFGVMGTDGRIFFFDDEEASERYFSSPFSPRARDLLRDVVDLAAALSVGKADDKAGIKVSLPIREVTIVPEDSSLLSGLFESAMALVRAFHRALGNLLGDGVLAKSSSVTKELVGGKSLAAMKQIERLHSGEPLTAGERLAALALRARILQGAGSLQVEIGAFVDDSDDDDNDEEQEQERKGEIQESARSNPKQQAEQPFSYPSNVILVGSFLKLGESFFSGYKLRFFALLDDHNLVYFNSRKQREAFCEFYTALIRVRRDQNSHKQSPPQSRHRPPMQSAQITGRR